MASRTTERTERAVRRVLAGQTKASAARAEDINYSTLIRALTRRRDSCDGALGRIVIVGAGALGRELRQWIALERRSEPIVFLDDTEIGPAVLSDVEGYTRAQGDDVLVAIADPTTREAVSDRFKEIATFVASSAIKADCHLGDGTILFPGSLVSTDAILGRGVIVNCQSSIGHDCRIGDFTTLSAHIDICGRVTIGKRVFLGSGARVLPGISIGDDAIVGAGAVVVRDVPAGSKVFGVPARAIS